MGLGHIDRMATAKGLYFHAPVKTEQAGTDCAFQDEIRTTIGLQDVWHRAAMTIAPAPLRRSRIGPNEPALLLRVTPVKIFVVETAL